MRIQNMYICLLAITWQKCSNTLQLFLFRHLSFYAKKKVEIKDTFLLMLNGMRLKQNLPKRKGNNRRKGEEMKML